MNMTKKKMITSGVALLCCVALLVGTTFAWFTDSVKVSGNKIQAGELKVEMNMFDGANYTAVGEDAIFSCDKLEPGHSEVAALQVANKGTLAFKYEFSIVATDKAATGLEKYIDVYYFEGGKAPEATASGITSDYAKLGTLEEVMQNGFAPVDNVISAGNSQYGVIVLKMAESIGNEAQGLASATFDVVLNATQAAEETDGFGSSQYDKDATYVSVSTAEGLEAAVKDLVESGTKGVIGLTSDVTLENGLAIKSSDANVTIDLGGNELAVENGGIVAQLGKVELTNGTITTDGKSEYVINAWVSDVTLSDVEIIGNGEDVAIKLPGGRSTNINLTNCKISGVKTGISTYKNDIIGADTYSIGTIKNVTIDATEIGIWLNGAHAKEITGCTITAPVALKMAASEYTLYSSTAVLTNTTLDGKVELGQHYDTATISLTIGEGCEITGKVYSYWRTNITIEDVAGKLVETGSDWHGTEYCPEYTYSK